MTPLDLFFIGFLMLIVGIFGFAALYDLTSETSKLKWWWLGIWCGPPVLKFWTAAVIAFFL